MTDPLCSVLIVSFKHSKYIHQAIEGALNQETEFPFEIVIGDDGSPDETPTVIQKWAQRHPNKIRAFCYPNNLGLFGKNNFATTLGHCRGKYVAFLEADDFWTDPLKLQRQITWLQNHQEYAFSYHAVSILSDDALDYQHKIYQEPVQDATTIDILEKHFIPTLSLVFRKEFLTPVPEMYFRVPSGDIVIELLMSLHGKARYFPETMGVYRNHSSGITKSDTQWNLQKTIGYLELYHSFNKVSKGKFEEKILSIMKNKLVVALQSANDHGGFTRIKYRWKIYKLATHYLRSQTWPEKKDTIYTFLIPRLYLFMKS